MAGPLCIEVTDGTVAVRVARQNRDVAAWTERDAFDYGVSRLITRLVLDDHAYAEAEDFTDAAIAVLDEPGLDATSVADAHGVVAAARRGLERTAQRLSTMSRVVPAAVLTVALTREYEGLLQAARRLAAPPPATEPA